MNYAYDKYMVSLFHFIITSISFQSVHILTIPKIGYDDDSINYDV